MKQSPKGASSRIKQESAVVCDPTLKFILIPNPQCNATEGWDLERVMWWLGKKTLMNEVVTIRK